MTIHLGNQPVPLVEAQDHEMLERFMCQPGHAEMLNLAPACQEMAVLDIGMAQIKLAASTIFKAVTEASAMPLC